MAKAMVELMEKLGHVRFALAGHDRGGRVAYRLALDHPGRLSKLAVLDIIPTYDMWQRMDYELAHEGLALAVPGAAAAAAGNVIDKAPVEYLDWKMASWTKAKDLSAFDPRALAHYRRVLLRSAAHSRDLRGLSRRRHHRSRARRGRPRRRQEDQLPDAGAVGRRRHPERERAAGRSGSTWATKVSGQPIDSGHFLAEENPDGDRLPRCSSSSRMMRRSTGRAPSPAPRMSPHALRIDAARLEDYLRAQDRRLRRAAQPSSNSRAGNRTRPICWKRRRGAMCCGASRRANCCPRRMRSTANSASSARCTRKASRSPSRCSIAPTRASPARRSM